MVKKGYKQTEVGIIPEDWEVNLLKHISEFTNGKAHESSVVEDGEFILINSKYISTEGRIAKRTNDAHCIAKTGQVLMVLSDIPNGKAIAKCYLVQQNRKYTVNQRICALTPNGDPNFLYYILNRNKYFLSFDDGAKQTNLRKDEVLNCLVPVPNISEQRKIGIALSDVDELITSLEALIKKKRALKTATMQQLLTGKTRLGAFGAGKGMKQTELGEIPEDWDLASLGEVGKPVIGLTYKPSDVSSEGTLVLRSSNIKNGALTYENNVFVKHDLPSRVITSEGDLLICVRNGSRSLIGKCALIDEKAAGSAFGAFMSLFKSDESTFVYFQFQSHLIKKQIEDTMGATINQITNKDLKRFRIPFPKLAKERFKITEVLINLEQDISSLNSRLTKTKALKQGMMQELLTGRTRLV